MEILHALVGQAKGFALSCFNAATSFSYCLKEMNLSFEAFETTSKDEDFQRSSRELGAHVPLMVNRSWVLNSRRSFENLVLRVCPCWGGSEEQLAALCLRKRQILPFLLKMRCDGFEDNVQNLGLL